MDQKVKPSDEANTDPTPGTSGHVLVAEDDSGIRNMLGHFLDSLGYRYFLAENGEEATRILASNPVSVLITDFQMPKMDGVELLDWCRARHLHIPVIFISANIDLVPREKIALEDCCATLMGKPIDLDTFTEALQSAAQHRHHANCLHQRQSPV